MSSFTYELGGAELPNGLDQKKLDRTIRSTLGKRPSTNLRSDDIVITFDTTLSVGEEATLNSIVSTHNPTPDTIGSQVHIISVKDNVANSNTTYKSLMTFTYPGYCIDTLSNIRIISYINTTANYFVRIYDITNNKTIAEATFNNTNESDNDMGTLSNIPFTNAILDIQIKVTSVSTRAYVRSLIIHYD